MKKIIDVCCGGRMFWFDKHNADVDFCDIRKLSTTLCDGRQFEVSPDIIADFRNLPFADSSYHLAVFDPPHIAKIGDKSYMSIKYGKLPPDWRDLLKEGFDECMRVLKPNGILIFKWNETSIPTSKVIEALGHSPLFGHKSGKLSKTQWLCFMKPEN